MTSPASNKLSVSISVHVDTPYRRSTMTVLGLKVRSDDVVSGVKSRVSAIAMIPFPDQTVLFAGKPLPDTGRLDECALEDGVFLDFVVCASDDIFAEQLAELIESNSDDEELSATQLGTLYFYKHGASASQALRILGCVWGEKFRDFLWRHPRFSLERGRVMLAPSGPGSPSSKAKAAGMCQNQAFLNLHAQLVSDHAIEQANVAMDHLCALVPDLLFFRVERVLRGGSVGTGLAIAGSVTAELLFIVKGLPNVKLERTLPSLHNSTAAILQERLVGSAGVVRVWQAGEAVRVQMNEAVPVDLFFVPASWSCTGPGQTFPWNQVQSDHAKNVRKAVRAEQTITFMQSLPEPLKMTIRVLKWWRGKWQWAASKTCPSDELLEYVAAWTANEYPPQDLYTAVMNAIATLARFAELKALSHPQDLSPAGECMFHVWNMADFLFFDFSEMVSYAQATQESLSASE